MAHSVPLDRPPVSGLVICYNEESNIEACLDSMAWCDEIIVVDSFSTDRTPELAQARPNVRFYQHAYRGGGAQRNWALELVRHDWVFVLDADERCTPDLRQEIEALLAAGPSHEAYMIRRRCFFQGRVLRFSGWQRDQVIRLFRRGAGYYSKRRVHEELVTLGPAPLLQHRIDHYFIERFDAYVERVNRYGYWGAAQCWRDGVRSSYSQVLVRPTWRFLRTYLLQLGILDGMRGLVFCMLQSYATYLKWSLLWSWHDNMKRGRPPVLPAFDDDPAVWQGLARIESARARRP